MFRIESYITPIIWSYFSKYVKNFNSHDFQVSLWNGGAVFSNLELNLDVLDSELQIPLTFASGHIQELKITVPWRKITSEPIVLNVKSMELVLKYKDVEGGLLTKKPSEEALQPKTVDPYRNDENSGYVRSLMTKIVNNVRVNFENVVIKYVESDIVFSVNVGEASMAAADENWKTTFIDRIAYSPEFLLRKKLSFSDVNICLDRCNNTGLVDKFHDPMLYRCDFDVRIIQKFATTFSRIPYFYRMDLFLGHLQFCVTDEQIPMLVRLYNLFTYLMQCGSIEPVEDESIPGSPSANKIEKCNGVEKDSEETKDNSHNDGNEEELENSESWTNWASSWLFSLPGSVFGEEESEVMLEENTDESHSDRETVSTPLPPEIDSKTEFQLPPPTTHFGVYVKTLTIIFKAVQKNCDRVPGVRKRVVNIFPFLKCSVQGICCDFILRGNENSHSLGVSSIMVHGLGFCPCGIYDCSSSEGGECYFEAGKIKQDFFALSLFNSEEGSQPEWCYDVDHKECLNYEAETSALEKTPAFFLKYVVTRNEVTLNEKDYGRHNSPEIKEVLYQCVAAPCKVLLCSGLLHRLKMINDAINNYGYEPYGIESILGSLNRNWNDLKYPLTTYRLVIRQPLIEILAADHPADYSPEKRAEFFKKNGGVVTRSNLPRNSPTWPRMVISFDSLECTGEDTDGHFSRLRNKLMGEGYTENSSTHRTVRGEEMAKWINQKLSKNAEMKWQIMEVLVSCVFEPVELSIGVKSCSMHSTFTNTIGLNSDICHRILGHVALESVTCSTRLEQRSNVLWLPFSVEMESVCDWEAFIPLPIISLKFEIDSLTLFVGPETLIALLQLSERLSEYLHEFVPLRAVSTAADLPNRPVRGPQRKFKDAFKNTRCERLKSDHSIEIHPTVNATQLFKGDDRLIWRYPQKRVLESLVIEPLATAYEFDGRGMKVELEYFEELTGQFHYYHSFTLLDRHGKTVRCSNEIYPPLASSIWRLRVVRNQESPFLDTLLKSLVVESEYTPSFNVAMRFPQLALNLVNNTYYAGKEVSCSALQSYANTDGVSPADHIMASFHASKSTIRFTSIGESIRCNCDAVVEVRVLDYESLMLESVTDDIFVGFEVAVPDANGNQAMSVVTDEVHLKIGASLVHSMMYSMALWTQVINSFDSKLCRMIPTENQTKIILNRLLVCNDLSCEIQIRSPLSDTLGADVVFSKDCKAVSLPYAKNCNREKQKLFVSCGAGTEVGIDVTKTGYSTKQFGQRTAFVHVSNLSASQRMIKISGPIIFANGLDHAIELSMFPYSETTPLKAVIPCREVGPTYLLALDEIEHVRYRITSSSSTPNPWSDVVYINDLMKNSGNGVASVLLALYKYEDSSVTKIQIWLSLVPETIQGASRYLLVVSPTYCIRSWLCADTFVHITTSDGVTADLYSAKGKGEEVQIRFSGEGDVTHHMKFQSNLNVPPSAASVPLLPSGPLLEKKTQTRPIDDILAEISQRDKLGQSSPNEQFIWPFVDEDILKTEWNTEINPETEITVAFTPWIEGLPTAVADIRPWALFINLSGVELLFAQDKDENEWDQYWVPYKCVFSPRRIHIPSGKFRIGLMMDDFLVKSPALQFSDEPERLSVKKINKDGKVPIDCYSRLDLFGGSQVACLTLETRIVNKILVVVVRPTYSIQNRTPFEVFVEGVTISSAVSQRRESWTDATLSSYSTLDPAPLAATTLQNGEVLDSATPILHFTTDGQDYSAKTPSYKYLALSCGGPWWFVQLVDCNEISDSASSPDGVPGTKMAVTLPKVDCTILNSLFRHKLKNFKVASEAVVVGSYTSRGQVWVSISQNNAPQLMLHNKTSLPLFCVEKQQKRKAPRHATPCFEQYLMLPPKSSCHYSFADCYNIFPQLHKREQVTPGLLLASISQDLVDLVSSHHPQSLSTILDRSHLVSTNKYGKWPSGNMLFSNFDIDWQDLPNVTKNPTQYAKFGRQSVKISVEIVGYTHHIFIENIKIKEVSAKSVRSRFTASVVPKDIPAIMGVKSDKSIVASNVGSRRGSILVNGASSDDEDEIDSVHPSLSTTVSDSRSSRSWRIKAFIPELYITMIDNIAGGRGSDEGFLALIFEPIVFEQVPIIEDSKIRPVECPRRESWVYSLRTGSIQVDTPIVEGHRPCEFPVAMVPVNRSNNLGFNIPKTAFDINQFWCSFVIPPVLNFDCTVTLTRVATNEINLETVWLKVLPFSLFIEDRLLTYIIPSFQNILNVFNESYIVLGSCASKAILIKLAQESEDLIQSTLMTHITIDDTTTVYPSLFYGEQDICLPTGRSQKRNGEPDSQTIFSRNISFVPTAGSSSSGLNSSSSSVVSSSVSNARLTSLSPPPPPPPSLPLEPHGFSSRLCLSKSLSEGFKADVGSSEGNTEENRNKDHLFSIHAVKIPKDLVKLFQQLSHPVRLKAIEIPGFEVELTLRTEKLVYVALDRSVVQLRPFKAYSSLTTDFHLGLELIMHYTMGTIFTLGNPVRVLGSLELLGSPGTLARTVGTGLRDLVVYPYEGILNGPVGFASGLGYGMASLMRSVTSGTLVSLTNWAESVSRNIDRLTLDQQEQLISEAARQVELQGFSDGFVQGLSGFGIRILGAIGGLSHHPIHNVIHNGPTTSSVIGGVGRGVIGAVVKPIGGVAEFVSLTGQGILLATGWKQKPKMRKPRSKSTSECKEEERKE